MTANITSRRSQRCLIVAGKFGLSASDRSQCLGSRVWFGLTRPSLSNTSCARQRTFTRVAMPWLLPSTTLSTTPADYQLIKQLREMRFNGKTWGPLKEEN